MGYYDSFSDIHPFILLSCITSEQELLTFQKIILPIFSNQMLPYES